MVKRLSDLIKEQDIVVHTLSHYPDANNSIKMEVGIEDCLHIEFEYNKSKYVMFECWLQLFIITALLIWQATLSTSVTKYRLIEHKTPLVD